MLSLNARGIRSPEKRQALLIWLQKQKVDIIFLQETYVQYERSWKQLEASVERPNVFRTWLESQLWCLSFGKGQLRITDDNGRYILLNAKVQGSDYILGNTYAPNKTKEQCNFFDELQQKLDDFITIHDQRIIIGGDFNVIMDQNLDCAGGSPKEKESVKFLNDICLNYDLIDIWRTQNPDSTLFTWR